MDESLSIRPGRFLGKWDPVTVTFGEPIRPESDGLHPEPPGSAAQRLLYFTPPHAGEYIWLSPSVLQFRPSAPWPPLETVRIHAGKQSFELETTMHKPLDTVPRDGAEDVEDGRRFTLFFDSPLRAALLEQVLSVRLRTAAGESEPPLEGMAVRGPYACPEGRFRYGITLPFPIPPGTLVEIRSKYTRSGEGRMLLLRYRTRDVFRWTRLDGGSDRILIPSEGGDFSRAQALHPEIEQGGAITLKLHFSSPPARTTTGFMRGLARMTPPGTLEECTIDGKVMTLRLKPPADVPAFRLALVPDAALKDRHGRSLRVEGSVRVWIQPRSKPPLLRLPRGVLLMEAQAPRFLPLEVRGYDQLDVRVLKVSAEAYELWPFPAEEVVTDESARPPTPDSMPAVDPRNRYVDSKRLAAWIRNVDTAEKSAILVPQRDRSSRGSARALLPLDGLLGKGKAAMGTYLVGVRALSGPPRRHWCRLQITDLALDTIETPYEVWFLVTRLSDGSPVRGARVRIEGWNRNSTGGVQTIASGVTDARGLWRWKCASRRRSRFEYKRITVRSRRDGLTVDPWEETRAYRDNYWDDNPGEWLAEELSAPSARIKAHLFCERPVYKPSETVHIGGFVRRMRGGRLEIVRWWKGKLIVTRPDGLEESHGVSLDDAGAFHLPLQMESGVTGRYEARLIDGEGDTIGRLHWKVEEYRVPSFEVLLDAPRRVSMDSFFVVRLRARYYSGGKLADRPVQWRVTSFPLAWKPDSKGYEDFVFSTGGAGEGRPRGILQKTAKKARTDEHGEAELLIDPSLEADASPRSYVVEATVEGDSAETVSSVTRIEAVPSFVVGLEVPRTAAGPGKLRVRTVILPTAAATPDGAGNCPPRKVTLKLHRKIWRSTLRLDDFTHGRARYVTRVEMECLSVRELDVSSRPVEVELDLPSAGLYVVEAEALDRSARPQTVRAECFAAGRGLTRWKRPRGAVFEAASDRESYMPGDEAVILLKSPFVEAHALAVLEEPSGVKLSLLEVHEGHTAWRLPIKGEYAPRIPVTFLLWKGRNAGTYPIPGNPLDPGRPFTMASTVWLRVIPQDKALHVEVSAPARAAPGTTIPISIRLKDTKGKPLSGEAFVWMVDKAVLALGREAPLDPLRDFMPWVVSRIQVRDTRNLVAGLVPTDTAPGGGEGEAEADEEALLSHMSIRKNFKAVPFFMPCVRIPEGGKELKIRLPDNLTTFAIRVKACSGPQRLGYGKGRTSVRLPLVVQPLLPPFVRKGDTFVAGMSSRVLDGADADGETRLRLRAGAFERVAGRKVHWNGNGRNVLTSIECTVPSTVDDGVPLVVTMEARRSSDGACDGMRIELPVLPALPSLRKEHFVRLRPGKTARIPIPAGGKGVLLASGDEHLLAAASALEKLRGYPYGCTEQKTSLAAMNLLCERLSGASDEKASEFTAGMLEAFQRDLLCRLDEESGLLRQWPLKGKPDVLLSAWAFRWLARFKSEDYDVDEKLWNALARGLSGALRSDSPLLTPGMELQERASALAALLSAGLGGECGYIEEIASKAVLADVTSMAQLLQGVAAYGDPAYGGPALALADELLSRGRFERSSGRKKFAGFDEGERDTASPPSPWNETVFSAALALEGFHGLDRIASPEAARGSGSDGTNRDADSILSRSREAAESIKEWLTFILSSARLDPYLTAPGVAAADALLTASIGDRSGGKRSSSHGSGWSLDVRRVAGKRTLDALEMGGGGAIEKRTFGGSSAETRLVLSNRGKNEVSLALFLEWPSTWRDVSEAENGGFEVERRLYETGAGGRPAGAATNGSAARAGGIPAFKVRTGRTVEILVRVHNPEQRRFVAVTIPAAAGLEFLNPELATSPPEAKPSAPPSREPTFVARMKEKWVFHYDTLPAGRLEIRVRARAVCPGDYTLPPARAEGMYSSRFNGRSSAARVIVLPAGE